MQLEVWIFWPAISTITSINVEQKSTKAQMIIMNSSDAFFSWFSYNTTAIHIWM